MTNHESGGPAPLDMRSSPLLDAQKILRQKGMEEFSNKTGMNGLKSTFQAVRTARSHRRNVGVPYGAPGASTLNQAITEDFFSPPAESVITKVEHAPLPPAAPPPSAS